MKRLLLINPSAQAFNLARQGFKVQPLGLAYLAALTPASWRIRIHDESFSRVPDASEADLVGITTLTATARRAYQLADGYRARGIPVVLGGIHASVLPEEAQVHADAVVVGEAESVWPRLLADLERGALAPRYHGSRDPLTHRLFPRRDLLTARYLFGSIQTSRGCPFDCEFCSVKAVSGAGVRQRAVEDVLDELETIPERMVFFTDDNLVGYTRASRERAKRIFEGMLARGIRKRWFFQSSLNVADDEELLALAARSGCIMVLIGIESLDEKVLRGTMKKGINAKRGAGHCRELVRTLHRHRIAVIGNMIFGSDEARGDEFEAAARFNLVSGLDVPWPGPLTPYPGTRLHVRLSDEDRILFRDYPADWSKYNTTVVIRPRSFTADELVSRFKRFARQSYSWPNILLRTARTLAYSRSLEQALLVYSMNASLARRFETGFRYPAEA